MIETITVHERQLRDLEDTVTPDQSATPIASPDDLHDRDHVDGCDDQAADPG